MTIRTADQAAPARKWVAVTKSDTVNFPRGVCAIYVGGTGDVVLVDEDGNAVTFSAVPAGTILPCQAVRVNSTSTTATLMVALY